MKPQWFVLAFWISAFEMPLVVDHPYYALVWLVRNRRRDR